MKRLTICILTACILMLMSGCADSRQELVTPVTCYYPLLEFTFGIQDEVLVAQQLEGAGHELDFSWLMNSYLQSTPPQNAAAFPMGLRLVDWTIEDDTLYLTFSDALASVRGVKLTASCAAIARTCVGLFDCRYVCFSTESAALNGEKEITIDTGTILFLDEEVPETTH
jgi:hypothetical protein